MSVSAVSCQGVAQAPFPPPPDVRRGGPDGLAKALGVTGADLRSAREQGQTLAQFAESKGISRDDLIAAVTSTMPKDGPAGASAAASETAASETAAGALGVLPQPANGATARSESARRTREAPNGRSGAVSRCSRAG